jgi:hypothetical protein
VAATVNIQMVGWSGNIEFIEEYLGHVVVIVLACVDNYFLDELSTLEIVFPDGSGDYRSFDELRAGAYDG